MEPTAKFMSGPRLAVWFPGDAGPGDNLPVTGVSVKSPDLAVCREQQPHRATFAIRGREVHCPHGKPCFLDHVAESLRTFLNPWLSAPGEVPSIGAPRHAALASLKQLQVLPGTSRAITLGAAQVVLQPDSGEEPDVVLSLGAEQVLAHPASPR